MKLYTKKMFLIAAEKCEVSMIDAEHIMEYIDEYVTPIELPIDEEIEAEALCYDGRQKLDAEFLRAAFISGAKWAIDKIQNKYFPQSSPHPGETLAEKLEEMEMGPKEFAFHTGMSEKTIIEVLKGKSSITPDMAVQFENVTKIPAHFWMNHQRGYDEYMAREKRKIKYKTNNGVR